MQAQHLEDALGVAGEDLQGGHRFLRLGHPHQLDLVELVHADQPAGLAPGRAGLAAETRRVGGIPHRQVAPRQQPVALEVGHRYLGRRHQEQLLAFGAVEVILELGQLAGARHAGTVHQEGHAHFGVAVFLGMHVEQEVDQRPLEACAGPAVNDEPAAADLGGVVEIEPALGGGQFHVVLGLEGEKRLLVPRTDDRIGGGVLPDRAELVREVGDGKEQVPLAGIGFVGLAADFLQSVAEALDLGHDGRRVLPLRLQFPDLLAQGVAARLQLLALGLAAAPPGIAGGHLVHQLPCLPAPREQAFLHFVGVLADQSDVEHGRP